MRIVRRLVAVVVPTAMLIALIGGTWAAPAAQAYGTQHVYQLTFSLNCNDKSA